MIKFFKILVDDDETSKKIESLINQKQLLGELEDYCYQAGKDDHFDLLGDLIKQNNMKIINILKRFCVDDDFSLLDFENMESEKRKNT